MGAGAINRKRVVASRPQAEITAGNFELQEAPAPELPNGTMLLKTRCLTVSPPARMALVSGGIARRPIPIGATMRGTGLAQVVESKQAEFAPDDLILGDLTYLDNVGAETLDAALARITQGAKNGLGAVA